MPDKDGILTEEDRKKVVDLLAKYPATAASSCPICGNRDWMLAERIVQPVTLGGGMGLQLGGVAGYPQIMLLSPCGYTRYINAVMLGILEPNASKTG